MIPVLSQHRRRSRHVAGGGGASPLLTDLISYWALDEASGNALDSHGTNDLTETSGTIASATGVVGNCRDFELGDTELFSRSDAAFSGFPSAAASWSFWLNLESYPNFSGIWSKSTWTSSTSFFFQINNSSGNGSINLNEAGNGILASGTYEIGVWRHYVVTFDGSGAGNADRLKFYKQGSPQAFTSFASTVPTSLTDSTAPFELGAHTSLNRYVDGLMDEVGFWGRALTADEVAELYNSGNGLPYPFS